MVDISIADGVLFYQVLDPVKAVYEVQDLGDAIETLCMTTLRNVMGSMELDELLSQRDTINAKLLHAIDDAAGSWGAHSTTRRRWWKRRTDPAIVGAPPPLASLSRLG